MKRRNLVASVRTAAGLFALLFATAALSADPPKTEAPSGGVARGGQIALSRCASCHAVGQDGESPSPVAPPFRTLRLRYNPIRMERHVQDLVRSGYSDMPPQGGLSEADSQAIAAYIESLRPLN